MSDPNRPANGHEGESAAEAGGSIFGRLKRPERESASGSAESGGLDQPGGQNPDAPEVPTADPALGGAELTPVGTTVADSRLAERTGTVQEPSGGVPAPDLRGGSGIAGTSSGSAELDRRAERRAERLVAFWFMFSVVGTLGFVVCNYAGDKHEQYYTPAMGTGMAMALFGLGFGIIIWAKRIMPDEEAVQEREDHTATAAELAAVEETFADGFADTRLAERPLLRRTLLGSAGALGLIAVVPVTNLFNSKPRGLFSTKWVKNARMVTEEGTPIKLGDLSIGGLVTVLPSVPTKQNDGTVSYVPQLTPTDKADSTTILIRFPPGVNKPRKGREDWAYADHVAYSKICTHAGCPVSLYEQQTHHLLCPCHQSVFDATDGARAIFGPAARSLPQLAITVDADGYFVAKNGDYTEAVGPGFWERP